LRRQLINLGPKLHLSHPVHAAAFGFLNKQLDDRGAVEIEVDALEVCQIARLLGARYHGHNHLGDFELSLNCVSKGCDLFAIDLDSAKVVPCRVELVREFAGTSLECLSWIMGEEDECAGRAYSCGPFADELASRIEVRRRRELPEHELLTLCLGLAIHDRQMRPGVNIPQ
jgi:hypothetical protein